MPTRATVMLFMLLILFHFSRRAGRQAKEKDCKSLETCRAWIFYPCHVGRFCEAKLFVHPRPSENSECDDDGRNIPRGIRPTGRDIRVCSPIAISQSSTNNLPSRKTSLLASLGISRISMFNLSFAFASNYTFCNSTLGVPSQCVKFRSSLFSKFTGTPPKTEVNGAADERGEKAESVSGSTRLPKARRSIKAAKRSHSSILTVLLESGCPNIEETRNKISDSLRRLRLRRITSRSRETVQLLCIHRDLVLSLRRSTSPPLPSSVPQSFLCKSK